MTIGKDQKIVNRDEVKQLSRRKVITVAASTAVVATAALPNKWTKPVVDSVFLPAHAQTSTTVLTSTIDADQEVPTPAPATDGATGTATVTFDHSDNSIVLSGTVTGLTGDAQMAHIHGPAAIGVTAPVLVTLVLGGTDLSNPTLSFSGPFPAANVDDLLNGLMYINVHTAANAPGEVRGQIEI